MLFLLPWSPPPAAQARLSSLSEALPYLSDSSSCCPPSSSAAFFQAIILGGSLSRYFHIFICVFLYRRSVSSWAVRESVRAGTGSVYPGFLAPRQVPAT